MRCLGLLVRVDRLGLRGFRLQRPDRLMRPGVWCILKKLVGLAGVLPGRRDRRGILGIRVRKAHKAFREPRAIPALKDHRASKGTPGIPALRAFRAIPGLRVRKVSREIPEIPEIPARRESKAYRVSRAFKAIPTRKALRVLPAGIRWLLRCLEIRLPERTRLLLRSRVWYGHTRPVRFISSGRLAEFLQLPQRQDAASSLM